MNLLIMDKGKGKGKTPVPIDEKSSHQHGSSSMHGHPDLEFRLGPPDSSNSSTRPSSLSLPQQGQQHAESSHQSHPISPIPQSKIQQFTPVDLEFHLGSPSNQSQQKRAKISEKQKDPMSDEKPTQSEPTFTHHGQQSPDLEFHLGLRPQLSKNLSKKPSTSLSLQILPHNPLELELATPRHDDSSNRLHGIGQIQPSEMHHPQEYNVQGNIHQHHSLANPAPKHKSPTHDQSNPDLEFHLGSSSGHAKQKMAQKGKDQMPASQTETTSTHHDQQSHDLGFHLGLRSVDSSNPKSSNNPSKKPTRPSPLQIPLPDPLELANKFGERHRQNDDDSSSQRDGTEQIQPRNHPQEPNIQGNIHQNNSGTKSTSNTQNASSSGLRVKFQFSDFPPTNTPKASSSSQQLHFIPSDFFPTDMQSHQTQHSEHSSINPHNKSLQQSEPSSSQAANPLPQMPSPGHRLFQRQHSEILLGALLRQFSNKSYESVGSSKIDQNIHPINSQPSQIPGTSEQRPPQYLRQNSDLSVSNFSPLSQKIRRATDLSNNVKEKFPGIFNFLNEMERKNKEDKPDTKKYEKLLESVQIPIPQEFEHQIDPLVPSASAQNQSLASANAQSEQLNSQPSQIPAGTSGQLQRPYLRQYSDIAQSSNQIQPSRMSRSQKPMQFGSPSQHELLSMQGHQSIAGGLRFGWRPSGTSNSPTKDENTETKQLLDSMEQQPLPPNLQMNTAEEEKSDDEQTMLGLGLMSAQKRGPNDEKHGEDKDEEGSSEDKRRQK